MVDLHKAVKIGCAHKGTNISNLSAAMGVNRKTLYSAISNGNPSIKTVEGIANALGVDLSTLIKWGE